MIKLYLNNDSAKTHLDLNLKQYSQFIKNNRQNEDMSKLMWNISAIVRILLNISDDDFSTEVIE